MFRFNKCEQEIQKYKNGYPLCHVRLRKNLFRVIFECPTGQTGLIDLQTLLKVGVTVHEVIHKLLTDPVSPL